MKTIQMTIDESLLDDVDRVVAALHTTRSAFIREALVAALRRQAVAELEHGHAQGYPCAPSRRESSMYGSPSSLGGRVSQGDLYCTLRAPD